MRIGLVPRIADSHLELCLDSSDQAGGRPRHALGNLGHSKDGTKGAPVLEVGCGVAGCSLVQAIPNSLAETEV